MRITPRVVLYFRGGRLQSEHMAALAWSWRNALHGAVIGLPAGIATLSDPQIGLAPVSYTHLTLPTIYSV